MPVAIACCSTSRKEGWNSLMAFCMCMTSPIRTRSYSSSNFTRRSSDRSPESSCRWLSEIREISCRHPWAPTRKDYKVIRHTILPANSEKDIGWFISTFRQSKTPAWLIASSSSSRKSWASRDTSALLGSARRTTSLWVRSTRRIVNTAGAAK